MRPNWNSARVGLYFAEHRRHRGIDALLRREHAGGGHARDPPEKLWCSFILSLQSAGTQDSALRFRLAMRGRIRLHASGVRAPCQFRWQQTIRLPL